MKRFHKVYLEISNICNLSCAFCPGTSRPKGAMTPAGFAALLPKLRPYTDYLYFHLMGEPLAHPRLGELLDLAAEAGFKVILTTNGTLLEKNRELLLTSPAVHKVNVSLHAFEANDLAIPFSRYLEDCFAFGRAARGHRLVIYRLWNDGGAAERNAEILSAMERAFPRPWGEDWRGARVADRIYLHLDRKFHWPSLSAPERDGRYGCYALKDQLGVLWDGTVVPCCLDTEGLLALGNLFEQELEEILASPRARRLRREFDGGRAAEPLCRRCGFAAERFGHGRKQASSKIQE